MSLSYLPKSLLPTTRRLTRLVPVPVPPNAIVPLPLPLPLPPTDPRLPPLRHHEEGKEQERVYVRGVLCCMEEREPSRLRTGVVR